MTPENLPLDVIKKCPLFTDTADDQLAALLACLKSSQRIYTKDTFIFTAESKPVTVGIVLSGSVHVIQEDFWGNRVILAHLISGEMFGEAFSCAEIDKMPVSVVAAETTQIMMIDYKRIVTLCSSACAFHTQLIKNMLRILAEKNIMLTRKMAHLAKRTTREKLLSFLSTQAVRTQNHVVEIPFNRQELADYLYVDRSALSRELGLMQQEGLLRFEKNRFELLRNEL